MKKLRLILLCMVLVVIAGFFSFSTLKEKIKNDLTRPVPYPTITLSPTLSSDSASKGPEKQSLFVPYWALKGQTNDQTHYDSSIYFGIAATPNGIDRKEQGFVRLERFSAFVPQGQKKLLGVRMIDSSANFAILKDTAKQKAIIEQTLAIAKEDNFDGIVLDLEVSAIPFESLVNQINDFTKSFYQASKRNGFSFSLTLYGDVFYRVRPFDVKTLAKNADTVLIMAYDFSKAKGNPGPNFPLQGSETYGYDYKKMTEDFLRVVPSEKITVVFGLFGYDWTVDGQGRALQQAQAVTAQEIQKKFIENCAYKNCSTSRDPDSAEGEIYYTDGNGGKHIVWFEDMESVAAKKAYLKTKGINSFSYWAYSYF